MPQPLIPPARVTSVDDPLPAVSAVMYDTGVHFVAYDIMCPAQAPSCVMYHVGNVVASFPRTSASAPVQCRRVEGLLSIPRVGGGRADGVAEALASALS